MGGRRGRREGGEEGEGREEGERRGKEREERGWSKLGSKIMLERACERRFSYMDQLRVEQELSRQLDRPGEGGGRDWREREREFPSWSFWRSPLEDFATRPTDS